MFDATGRTAADIGFVFAEGKNLQLAFFHFGLIMTEAVPVNSLVNQRAHDRFSDSIHGVIGRSVVTSSVGRNPLSVFPLLRHFYSLF